MTAKDGLVLVGPSRLCDSLHFRSTGYTGLQAAGNGHRSLVPVMQFKDHEHICAHHVVQLAGRLVDTDHPDAGKYSWPVLPTRTGNA